MGGNPASVTNEEAARAETDQTPQGELLRIEVTADQSNLDYSTVRVVLDGELDPHTAPNAQRQIDEVIDRGCQVLVLDLGSLCFIDSAGLRVVISAHKRIEAAGGALIIDSPSDTARKLFEITGLTDHLTLRDSRS